MKTIGEQLKEARDKAGLTQLQLASKATVSIGTIGALEQGSKTSTSVTVLALLGKVLKIKFVI